MLKTHTASTASEIFAPSRESAQRGDCGALERWRNRRARGVGVRRRARTCAGSRGFEERETGPRRRDASFRAGAGATGAPHARDAGAGATTQRRFGLDEPRAPRPTPRGHGRGRGDRRRGSARVRSRGFRRVRPRGPAGVRSRGPAFVQSPRPVCGGGSEKEADLASGAARRPRSLTLSPADGGEGDRRRGSARVWSRGFLRVRSRGFRRVRPRGPASVRSRGPAFVRFPRPVCGGRVRERGRFASGAARRPLSLTLSRADEGEVTGAEGPPASGPAVFFASGPAVSVAPAPVGPPAFDFEGPRSSDSPRPVCGGRVRERGRPCGPRRSRSALPRTVARVAPGRRGADRALGRLAARARSRQCPGDQRSAAKRGDRGSPSGRAAPSVCPAGRHHGAPHERRRC